MIHIKNFFVGGGYFRIKKNFNKILINFTTVQFLECFYTSNYRLHNIYAIGFIVKNIVRIIQHVFISFTYLDSFIV